MTALDRDYSDSHFFLFLAERMQKPVSYWMKVLHYILRILYCLFIDVAAQYCSVFVVCSLLTNCFKSCS